jgi:hypothetical protein
MRIQDNGSSITLWASANDTYTWAHRSGSAWPCSTLADHRFCASFDDNGLCDLTVDGRQDSEDAEIDGHELSAICADLLGARIKPDHPCWYVTIGQFR